MNAITNVRTNSENVPTKPNKLYLGSRDYKPAGFKTVDIDPRMNPDIVANICKMDVVPDASVDEIVAGHVLEHIDWPDSFLAIAEFARVLKIGGIVKIAVPDLTTLLRMLLSGDSAFHVVALIYGVGGRENKFEQHRFGFTAGMLVDILESLGFSQFDWWNSNFSDASNGWVPRFDQRHVGVSLNIQATKVRAPAIDPAKVYDALVGAPMDDYLAVAASTIPEGGITSDTSQVPKLYQRIHFHLIEARQRIAFLESRSVE